MLFYIFLTDIKCINILKQTHLYIKTRFSLMCDNRWTRHDAIKKINNEKQT